MKKEYECYICDKNPCRFIVNIKNEKTNIPDDCPFHNDFKAKWIEKRKNK